MLIPSIRTFSKLLFEGVVDENMLAISTKTLLLSSVFGIEDMHIRHSSMSNSTRLHSKSYVVKCHLLAVAAITFKQDQTFAILNIDLGLIFQKHSKDFKRY